MLLVLLVMLVMLVMLVTCQERRGEHPNRVPSNVKGQGSRLQDQRCARGGKVPQFCPWLDTQAFLLGDPVYPARPGSVHACLPARHQARSERRSKWLHVTRRGGGRPGSKPGVRAAKPALDPGLLFPFRRGGGSPVLWRSNSSCRRRNWEWLSAQSAQGSRRAGQVSP